MPACCPPAPARKLTPFLTVFWTVFVGLRDMVGLRDIAEARMKICGGRQPQRLPAAADGIAKNRRACLRRFPVLNTSFGSACALGTTTVWRAEKSAKHCSG